VTDQTKFKLLAAFKEMKQPISMSDFNDRLIFQKKTYLLQETGLKLGNSYGWYLRGPYSRDAANDGFQLQIIQNHVEGIEPLSLPEKKSVEKLQAITLESQKMFRGKNESYLFEMLASLHFVVKHGYPRPKNERDALKRFSKLKPQFAENAKEALKLLKKYELI
jgi:uncharacterized protein YwgA